MTEMATTTVWVAKAAANAPASLLLFKSDGSSKRASGFVCSLHHFTPATAFAAAVAAASIANTATAAAAAHSSPLRWLLVVATTCLFALPLISLSLSLFLSPPTPPFIFAWSSPTLLLNFSRLARFNFIPGLIILERIEKAKSLVWRSLFVYSQPVSQRGGFGVNEQAILYLAAFYLAKRRSKPLLLYLELHLSLRVKRLKRLKGVKEKETGKQLSAPLPVMF